MGTQAVLEETHRLEAGSLSLAVAVLEL